jgi:hypothetical protein
MACRRADHTGEKRADIAMNYIQGTMAAIEGYEVCVPSTE